MSDNGVWYEMTAMFKKDQAEVIDVEGKNLFVRGTIDNLIIAQVKVESPDNSKHLHEGLMKMMERVKERGHLQGKEMMVLDDNVEMVRMSRVDDERAKLLESQYQAYLVARSQGRRPGRLDS